MRQLGVCESEAGIKAHCFRIVGNYALQISGILLLPVTTGGAQICIVGSCIARTAHRALGSDVPKESGLECASYCLRNLGLQLQDITQASVIGLRPHVKSRDRV